MLKQALPQIVWVISTFWPVHGKHDMAEVRGCFAMFDRQVMRDELLTETVNPHPEGEREPLIDVAVPYAVRAKKGGLSD